MTPNLFTDTTSSDPPLAEQLGPGSVILRRFGLAEESTLLHDLESVINAAPFRHMVTPGGFTMSVAMTNCGALGWISDRRGYRYEPADPQNKLSWPPMPASFLQLASAAASQARFDSFIPDACQSIVILPELS